jgi:hypothetical protein
MPSLAFTEITLKILRIVAYFNTVLKEDMMPERSSLVNYRIRRADFILLSRGSWAMPVTYYKL